MKIKVTKNPFLVKINTDFLENIILLTYKELREKRFSVVVKKVQINVR